MTNVSEHNRDASDSILTELTVKEFALIVEAKQQPATVLRLLKKYGIPHCKKSGRYFVPREAIPEWKRHQEARSKTAWKDLGRSIKKGEEPLHWVSGRVGNRQQKWAVYAEDQTKIRRRLKDRPAVALEMTSENILIAMFTVNRSAKRYRDAATSCYRSRVHGFAGTNSTKKKELYELKEAGIIHAFKEGWLQAVEQHGSMCVYRGFGFCFHSPLFPRGIEFADSGSEIFVESKPKETSEIRLKDAIATLEQLGFSEEGFERKQMACFRRQAREYEQFDDVYGDDDGYGEDEE